MIYNLYVFIYKYIYIFSIEIVCISAIYFRLFCETVAVK